MLASASAIARGLQGSTTIPPQPLTGSSSKPSMISRQDPTSVETIGNPVAAASSIVIGWAFRQVAVCCAVLVLFYAMIGYKLFEQPSATEPPAAASASAASANRAPARGGAPNSLEFRANRDGHVYLDAAVNGASVHFVVDTGATPVALTMKDAMAAGISRQDLVFNKRMSTANGTALAAAVKLRELRVELRKGETHRLHELITHLESIGFERVQMVEDVAQFSVRGGIFATAQRIF